VNSSHEGILDPIREPFELSRGARLSPLGNGHINETVLVEDGTKRLVAQRINTHVFPRPGQLVSNARLIERHLARKPGGPAVVRHLAGIDGRYLYGPESDVRVLEYIPGSRSIEILENPLQGERAAHAFARFSGGLADFEATRLETVIADFHCPSHRWRQFVRALSEDRADRAQYCPEEITQAQQVEQRIHEWQRLADELPVRVCHNDCKINNLLVHRETAKPLAVIDLDTCMPGVVLCDFGDLVRTCCSPEAEDSTNLEAVRARPEVYEALFRGYVKGWQGHLTVDESASLFSGGLMMTFLVGLRFLTDYLDGDRYFAVKRPHHNLDRARNQIRLFSSLLEQAPELRATVEHYVREAGSDDGFR
jgi:thiamine kinase-like enzyme